MGKRMDDTNDFIGISDADLFKYVGNPPYAQKRADIF
jgi:hypothetical protein